MSEIRILYDNHAGEGLRPGFGFSAIIRTEGAVVMLDTGADKLVLEENARALGVNLEIVTALAISHDHCDHMGAISSVLHKGLHLYVPADAGRRFSRVTRGGIDLHKVRGPVEIVPGVRSIGQYGRRIPEHALLVDGKAGPAMITGCAHPGIVKMARRATDLAGRPLALLLGGFHLLRVKEDALRRTVDDLLKLEIQRMAPCHCTGDDAVAALRDAFAERFVEIEAGSTIGV